MLIEIKNSNELKELLSSDVPKLFLYKLSSEYLHSENNGISCGYIKLTNDREYIFSITHQDLIQIQKPNFIKNAIIPNLKDSLYFFECKDCIDLSFDIDISSHITNAHKFYYSKYEFNYVNEVIPITKHIEYFQSISNEINVDQYWSDHYNTKESEFYSHKLPTFLKRVESSGISVDVDRFIEHYPDKSSAIVGNHSPYFVYSHYNYYTKTRRPSNAYLGINFAALNKNDKTRESFVSRHENGKLINIDFKAFHIFLIAKRMGIIDKIGKDPHVEFARYWFNIDEISDKMYDRSKIKTFAFIYGQDTEQSPDHIFFQKTKELSDFLWNEYKKTGKLKSNLGATLKIEDATQNKIFNYYIQSLETETAIPLMEQMVALDCEVVPILYTYDSILFDCPPNHIDSFISKLKQMDMEFPFSVEIGDNYNEMFSI